MAELMESVSSDVSQILSAALDGEDITVDDACVLLDAKGVDYNSTLTVADELRRKTVGDIVTYVVNRNINFTNVCIKGCGFCAFSRDFREEQGYFLPVEEIVRRSREAWEYGATEVCIQAGLPPQMEGDLYIRLCEAIKKELPDIHIHGFSPEEVLYGSIRSKVSIKEYLISLKNAGVGSLPGTSAEILDQALRDEISPGRITKDQWIEVITTAHELSIPTTSTIMFGHVETNKQVAEHIGLIRDLQKETGGFTEFVPLPFIPYDNKMGKEFGITEMASMDYVFKLHSIARLFFKNHIKNIQVSWPKIGLDAAKISLNLGVNDLGGTLIEENISRESGSEYGQSLTPQQFNEAILSAGKIPVQRTTNYQIIEQDDPDFRHPKENDFLILGKGAQSGTKDSNPLTMLN